MSEDNQADGKAEMNAADEREDLLAEIADLRARLAAAWAEGYEQGRDDAGDDVQPERYTANPYEVKA